MQRIYEREIQNKHKEKVFWKKIWGYIIGKCCNYIKKYGTKKLKAKNWSAVN